MNFKLQILCIKKKTEISHDVLSGGTTPVGIMLLKFLFTKLSFQTLILRILKFTVTCLTSMFSHMQSYKCITVLPNRNVT